MINLPEFDTGLYEGCELQMLNGRALLKVNIAENPSFSIRFNKVRWHQFTALPNCSAEMIENSYFMLSELQNSDKHSSFLAGDTSSVKTYKELHHFRIFLDETGCHEFIAESAYEEKP
ncbi:MAG TPA: hypothetical protein EYM37_09650 [Methylophaga aminisulfidivorans]|uniref:hypothetical protein n=1 Tax=Methylophaga TaxID=40222 RepID=UPI00175D4689|nr:MULTISPECIES: hypothetical protein [Methylophaga]HIC47195.1 hypothetical protein [Methylophaga sp.]HIM40184.1 hypothetical protein [Methylophaga aminisulfidivorans]